MAKKRYDDGGVTEGRNANIDDDTRSRALAWAARMAEKGDAEAAAPRARAAAPRARVTDTGDETGRLARRVPASSRSSVDSIPKSSPAGWTGGKGERVTGSTLSRNFENTLNAIGPGGALKVARAGVAIPAEMRATRAAQQAYNSRAALRRSEEGMNADEAARFLRSRALSEADTTGGAVGYKKGGAVKKSSASSRADGIAQRGKTRGKYL